MYAAASITLLDDVFSALDASTEEHGRVQISPQLRHFSVLLIVSVFNALFGMDGLLQGKTVLLVTHNRTSYLQCARIFGWNSNIRIVRHLATADHIFVLECGRIAHSGTLEQIRADGYDYTASHVRAERDVRVVEAEESTEQKEGKDVEDDETASSLSRKGFGPYLFFSRMSGWWRMVISLVSVCVFDSI